MSAVNDGGPAFPSAPTVGPSGDLYRPADIGCAGLSVRDYFAAKALAGMMSGQTGYAILNSKGENTLYATALMAYQLADAMLKARSAS